MTTSFTPTFPTNLTLQEPRSSAASVHLPYALSSPPHSVHSGFSPVQHFAPHTSSGYTSRPLSAHHHFDLPRPSFGSATSAPWDAHTQSVNQHHQQQRQSWTSTASAGGGHLPSFSTRQSQPYIDNVSGSSTSSTIHHNNRFPPHPPSGSYEYELDQPTYNAQHLRSAGLPPSFSSHPAPSNERWSIGSAYAQPPVTTSSRPSYYAGSRVDEGSETSFPDSLQRDQRYPTPELVYFPEGNNHTNASGDTVRTYKRQRQSATPSAQASRDIYPELPHPAPPGFIDDWSYPTLAPVQFPHSTTISRPTSPLGTVHPTGFTYAYPDPPTPVYAHSTREERLAVLEEQKRDTEEYKRRRFKEAEVRGLRQEELSQYSADEEREYWLVG